MTGQPIRILDQRERDPRLFQRDDLFDREGRSLLLLETQRLKKIDLRDLIDGVELRVRGLVGHLPLTPHIVLNLIPKFPIGNLWRMLQVSHAEYDSIYPVLRSYQTTSATPPHEVLAKGFCHYLRAVLTVGIARGYLLEDYRGYYRPKVQFGRTVASYLSRGDQLNVASDLFQFSAGIRSNALLKSACLAFLRVIPRGSKWDEERRLIGEALNALGAARQRPMLFGEEAAAADLPLWLRRSYQGALTIYAVLLGYSRVGFAYEAHGTEMPSFLFSLDSVFENYVRNTFREALVARKIAVLNGDHTKHHGRLFLDNQRYPTKPDVIFRQNKAIVGLAEIKYKPTIEENDRYQLISHVLAAESKVGVWISPAEAGKFVGLQYVGTVPTGAKFYHYQIDIGGDLDAASASMVHEVSALFTP